MRVHWLQHVPFEGLGAIEPWLLARQHALTCTRLYAGEIAPAIPDGFDWLIAMGGSMNVYQYRDYPWLRTEKRLISHAVSAGKRVLGICLGAQLLADALGGKAYQNAEREIGWFPVRAVPVGVASPFKFPPETKVFHWHGDTFSLPPGSTRLAESDGCANQAFAIGSRVLGLQCHLEMTPEAISRIAKASGDQLTPGRYIQPADKIIAEAKENGTAAVLLYRLLSTLENAGVA